VKGFRFISWYWETPGRKAGGGWGGWGGGWVGGGVGGYTGWGGKGVRRRSWGGGEEETKYVNTGHCSAAVELKWSVFISCWLDCDTRLLHWFGLQKSSQLLRLAWWR